MILEKIINEIGMTMTIVYSVSLIIVFAIQYILMIHSTIRMKSFSIGLSLYLLLHSGVLLFYKSAYGSLPAFEIGVIVLIIIAFNIPILAVTFILREIVYFIRKVRFERGLKKGYRETSSKSLLKIGKVLPLYCRRETLKVNEVEQLKHIYKDSKNDVKIPLKTRILFCKSLIAVGMPNISVPHTYDINMDSFASQDDILKVAHSSLNEAKLIVSLAPNACVFSCRKYAENLSKYLFKFHQLQSEPGEDLESFSTVLFLLNKHKVIEDKEVLHHFYHIKEVGNDAAHGHFCDAKTAADVVDDALYIDQWFRTCYKDMIK